MITRRQALKNTALAGALCAAASFARPVVAQPPPPRPGGQSPGPVPPPGTRPPPGAPAPDPSKGPFGVPPLPYPVDALEPHIDARTMEIHHDKHHQAYVTNLNKTVFEYPDVARRPAEQMLRELNNVPEKIRTAVRNFAGGHYNHMLFWETMKKGGGNEPRGELGKAIAKSFGSFSAFRQQLTESATRLFGSGWVWLVLDGKDLKIEATPNQDSPLTEGRYPLLGIDVWEHAYYLKYQNRRPEYIEAWFQVINWEFVHERHVKHVG